jgi:hypothetical protein
MNKQGKSITVEFWDKIFWVLSFISIFHFFCCVLKKVIKPKNWYSVVDIWVLFNFFFAFISIFIVKYFDLGYCIYIFIIYGLIRVFEIIVYQINVLLFDEYRTRKKGKQYKIRGYRRMVVNLLCNFVEIVFWFSVSYICFLTDHFTREYNPSLLQVMLTSFSYTTGFGIHDLLSLPKLSSLGTSILYFQSIAGLVMTLISIARFIGLLPPVESMDEYENSTALNNKSEI